MADDTAPRVLNGSLLVLLEEMKRLGVDPKTCQKFGVDDLVLYFFAGAMAVHRISTASSIAPEKRTILMNVIGQEISEYNAHVRTQSLLESVSHD
jgi:hypothetical protein